MPTSDYKRGQRRGWIVFPTLECVNLSGSSSVKGTFLFASSGATLTSGKFYNHPQRQSIFFREQAVKWAAGLRPWQQGLNQIHFHLTCSYQESSLRVPRGTRRTQPHWEGFSEPAWPEWATCSWKGRALKSPTTQHPPSPQPLREARPREGRNPQQLPQQEGCLAAQTSGPELIPGKGVRLSPVRLKETAEQKGCTSPCKDKWKEKQDNLLKRNEAQKRGSN